MPDFVTHISTSGGLLSAAFIQNIRELGARQRGIEPESFALPRSPAPRSPAALEATIASAWELLKERWDAVAGQLPMLSVSQVRDRWLMPLVQVLDFDPVYQRADIVLDAAGDLRYPISHRGWPGDGAPALHTVSPAQSLDARAASGRGVKAKSPHDMVQAFLNTSPTDTWAILSNGFLLRLLRDYHHTFTKGYVQFDLESLFETRNYGDFRALYRLCHASRFRPSAVMSGKQEPAGDEETTLSASPAFSVSLSPLEFFYKDSLATGVKVGEDLRGQVRQAIETLGNGFLDGALIGQLQKDQDLCRRYYSEILRVIYRILFLLFAEQRGLLPHTGAPRENLYRSSYSMTALRTLAEGDNPVQDDCSDLWRGLQVTFRMAREGVPDLGVFGYDGMLFEDGADTLLSSPPAPNTGGESRACTNSALMQAIRSLTLVEREGVRQRISYADLGVEELGSIYESLLDFTPRVSTVADVVEKREIAANAFFLDPRGSERKTTGSYYTHPSLVNELIKSALLPVVRDRLAQAGLPVVDEKAIGEATAGLLTDYAGLTSAQRQAGEEAILNMKVCDLAAGSGHFLVKANNALGAELARIRTGDEYPTEEQVQAAKRDVLAHCIYGVDLNPMAVELCKVSLWINASVRDHPLSFLDHHIKCGNSLIGATPELLANGIPDEAFEAVTGDDKAIANAVRKRNRQERERWQKAAAIQGTLWTEPVLIETPDDLRRWRALTDLAEEDPQAARQAYGQYTTAPDFQQQKLEADLWTAAFFWPLDRQSTNGGELAPTDAVLHRLQRDGPAALDKDLLDGVARLADKYRFFHWHVEFPDVFAANGKAGFDVILGNPPWERIKLQEKEFYAERDPQIANAATASLRGKMIEALLRSNPVLAADFASALRASETESLFIRNSGRFPLTGVGDVNTYAVFADLGRQITSNQGRLGIIVESGIAMDYTYRGFFADLVASKRLVSFYDFENKEGLFPGLHRTHPHFCLLTISGTASVASAMDLAFWCTNVDHISEAGRRFSITPAELAFINPNTRTLPVFRTASDAVLTRKMYQAASVLLNEETGENQWALAFQAMFHMTNDSYLFKTEEQLRALGGRLVGNRFVGKTGVYLPLYEAKMFWHFDHHYGTYRGVKNREDVHLPETSTLQHTDACFPAHPWYWVEYSEAAERLSPKRGWVLAFRDITNTTNERTGVFSVLPWSALSNKAPILLPTTGGSTKYCALLANLDAICFDYVIRQKMGGTSLNFYIVKQLPVLPPDCYTPALLAFMVPRVLELTYTAWDLIAFADDVWNEADAGLRAAIELQWQENVRETGGGHAGAMKPEWVEALTPGPSPDLRRGERFPHPPFKWDEERRARLRAQLDALYAHLYGLTRDELSYILDTFPIVRRKDEAKWGEYRTRRWVMEEWDKVA